LRFDCTCYYLILTTDNTNRPISLAELQFSATSSSTDTSNTSSPSSLTTSTSSSNNDQALVSPPALQKSIKSLKLELEQSNKQSATPPQPMSNQHVLTNKQNQLNNVKTNSICMNHNLIIKKNQSHNNMDASIEIVKRDVFLKKNSNDILSSAESKNFHAKKPLNLVSKIKSINNNSNNSIKSKLIFYQNLKKIRVLLLCFAR
jgi:hypothetical protein